ncbi:MFS transporter [Bartonella sp. DGB1]|uniref:MFS transporter n=1 Tax=Bartonella sp. DGB1 TaxID=3239807 RepID=UPI0035249D6F
MNSLNKKIFINRNFACLWLGQIFSSFGEYLFSTIVIIWLIVDIFKDSSFLTTAVASIVLATAIPRMVFSIVAGTWADRLLPVYVMITADIMRSVTFIIFMLLYLTYSLSALQLLVTLLILLFFNGIMAQFFNASRQTVMQLVIPSERRIEASSKSMFALTGIAVITGAIGPSIFLLLGPLWVLVINILTFLSSMICICFIKNLQTRPKKTVQHPSFWCELWEGLQFTWNHKKIRVLAIGVALYGFTLGINNVMLSIYSLKTLGFSAVEYGWILTAFPIGGAVATFLVKLLSKVIPLYKLFSISLILLGCGYLAYALTPPLFLAWCLLFLCGILFSLFAILQGPILQIEVTNSYMGRVSSTITSILAFSSLIGTAMTSQSVNNIVDSLIILLNIPLTVYGAYIFIAGLLLIVGGLYLLYTQHTRKTKIKATF